MLVIPVPCEQGQQDYCGFLITRQALDSRRHCPKGTRCWEKWIRVPNVIFLVSMPPCRCTQSHVPMYMHTHTYAHIHTHCLILSLRSVLCLRPSSNVSALEKASPAPPCKLLSVLCDFQIAFAIPLWTNQVSTARPISIGFSPASCISDRFSGLCPALTSLWLSLVDENAGCARLHLLRAG